MPNAAVHRVGTALTIGGISAYPEHQKGEARPPRWSMRPWQLVLARCLTLSNQPFTPTTENFSTVWYLLACWVTGFTDFTNGKPMMNSRSF